jgi:hypothetical protein
MAGYKQRGWQIGWGRVFLDFQLAGSRVYKGQWKWIGVKVTVR